MPDQQINTLKNTTVPKPILIKEQLSEKDKLALTSEPTFWEKLWNKFLKPTSWLVETVFRGMAGYIILVDKTPSWAIIVALCTGIYMTATSIGLMAYHFIKAYND